jgi:diacylglycerol kinase family enzyme
MRSSSQTETGERARIAIRLSSKARKVLISMNPRAGYRARHVHTEAIASQLRLAGFQVELPSTLEDLRSIALECQHSGELRTVLAIGGDGTASAVRRNVPLEVPLLVIPMGTENLLGRYLRQSTDTESIREVVEKGVVIELDLCQANGQPFLLMISAGFDAAVVRALHEGRKGNIRRSSYFGPTLRAMRSYEYPEMRIYWGGQLSETSHCRWLFGFNLPLYALGLPIAPEAVGTDGKLDVCTFARGSIWNAARYFWHIIRREHCDLPDAGLRQAQQFRIEPAEGSTIAYQLDGDFAGILPVDVDVLPRQLKLLVSLETARRLGFQT